MSIVLGIGDTWMLANWNRWHGDATTHDRPLPWYPHEGDPTPPDIGTGHYQPPPIPQGWQCPLCKTVYAPSVTQCRCAKVAQWQGTVTGGGIATKPQNDQEADSEIPPMPKPLGVHPTDRRKDVTK